MYQSTKNLESRPMSISTSTCIKTVLQPWLFLYIKRPNIKLCVLGDCLKQESR